MPYPVEDMKSQIRSNLAGTVLESRPDEQLEEPKRGRRQKQKPNMEEVEPRRSLRLAQKNVTVGRKGTMDDPEVLPYYMQAMESGYAGTKKRDARAVIEEEDPLAGLQWAVCHCGAGGRRGFGRGCREEPQGGAEGLLWLPCWL